MLTIKTCEFVSPKHPDKLCDFIADSLMDAYLKGDKNSRTAIEVMGGHGVITVSGEITSQAEVDISAAIKDIVGAEYRVEANIVKQSPEIAQGVDTGGAGDQGIMMGFATSETETHMPKEYELARSLCRELYKRYPYDGKVQVTLGDGAITAVVASFQNTKTKELEELVRSLIKADEYFVNPAGEWHIGGFDADSGLSGRKIIIDNYGPEINVGGGSFSGKDATKVDRSAAYMARKIAVDLLKQHGAKEVKTKLAYAIGKAEPLMQVAYIDGKEEKIKGYDLTPQGIKSFLQLDRPIFAETSQWGHFGNGFLWE
ncbi:MAG: methionine adenosyltransferase domain-containing protein [bacterium]|nr:methionine adenosyltransferase domain-containing protein [bacterium]